MGFLFYWAPIRKEAQSLLMHRAFLCTERVVQRHTSHDMGRRVATRPQRASSPQSNPARKTLLTLSRSPHTVSGQALCACQSVHFALESSVWRLRPPLSARQECKIRTAKKLSLKETAVSQLCRNSKHRETVKDCVCGKPQGVHCVP